MLQPFKPGLLHNSTVCREGQGGMGKWTLQKATAQALYGTTKGTLSCAGQCTEAAAPQSAPRGRLP